MNDVDPSAGSGAGVECVFEYHIRGETNNLWCVTHEMWRDKSESSSEPNLEHLHGSGCMCPWCTSERLTYCALTRGLPNHPDHQVVGCPSTTVTPPGESP